MSRITHYNPSRPPVHAEIVPLACSAAALLLLFALPDFGYVANTLVAPGGSESATATQPAFRIASMALALAGQFAHIDISHLFFNLVGLWLVCWGFKPWRSAGRDVAFLGAGLLGVAAGLLGSPEITWYKGLSGALHGLFCGYAMCIASSDERWRVKAVAVVLLTGAAVKLVLEDPAMLNLIGPQWVDIRHALPVGKADASGKPVLYEAHRWGALAGLVAGLVAGLLSVRMAGKQ